MKSDDSVVTAFQFFSLFTICRVKKLLLKDHLMVQEMTSKIFSTECVYCGSLTLLVFMRVAYAYVNAASLLL